MEYLSLIYPPIRFEVNPQEPTRIAFAIEYVEWNSGYLCKKKTGIKIWVVTLPLNSNIYAIVKFLVKGSENNSLTDYFSFWSQDF